MNEHPKRATVELLRAPEEPARTVGEKLTLAELKQVDGGGYVPRIGTIDLFDVRARVGPIIG
jgi:hypothetical protein